jgi:hypothetical protein
MVQHGDLRQSRQAGRAPQPAQEQVLTSRGTLARRNGQESSNLSAPPLIVFDVNETLLDLETMAPTFERIFGEESATCSIAIVRLHVLQMRAGLTSAILPGALSRYCRLKLEIAQIAHAEALSTSQVSELDMTRAEEEMTNPPIS